MSVQGLFGKVPAHGDFVDRGLPSQFVQSWDQWLQQCITSSKAELGDSWLEAYLTSPVWRFALGRGVCGEQGWCGVLVPSVDKVGRHFPLTIAAAVDPEQLAVQAMVASPDWYEGAQGVALRALEEGAPDADALAALITDLGEVPLGAGISACDGVASLAGARVLSLPFTVGSTLGHGLMALTHRMLEAELGGSYSVWWTLGSERVHPGLFVAAGLPLPDAFSAFLTDQSSPPGWVRLAGYDVGGASPAAEVPAAPEPAPPERVDEAEPAPDEGAPSAPSQFADLLGDAGATPGEPSAPPAASEDDAPGGALDDIEPQQVSVDEILAGFDEPPVENDDDETRAPAADEDAGEDAPADETRP